VTLKSPIGDRNGYFHRRRGDIQAIQPFTQTLIYSHEFSKLKDKS